MLGLADRAERRAREVLDGRTGDHPRRGIRDSLRDGNSHEAFNRAISALQTEAKRLERRRPQDATLARAEIAGSIAGIAARLYETKPGRPPGCPRVPRPEDLLAVFEAAYRQATGSEGSQQ